MIFNSIKICAKCLLLFFIFLVNESSAQVVSGSEEDIALRRRKRLDSLANLDKPIDSSFKKIDTKINSVVNDTISKKINTSQENIKNEINSAVKASPIDTIKKVELPTVNAPEKIEAKVEEVVEAVKASPIDTIKKVELPTVNAPEKIEAKVEEVLEAVKASPIDTINKVELPPVTVPEKIEAKVEEVVEAVKASPIDTIKKVELPPVTAPEKIEAKVDEVRATVNPSYTDTTKKGSVQDTSIQADSAVLEIPPNLLDSASAVIDSAAVDQIVETDTAAPVVEVQAEAPPKGTWAFGGTSTITTNQSQFSNWQGGGQNSIAISTSLDLSLNYTSENLNWENTFAAGYGIMLQGVNAKWFKNDDRLELTTKLGKKASKNWFYTALITPSTQFQPGYNSELDTIPISEFFAPGYVVGSLGFDYNPSSKLSIFIGPVTSKNTFVLNQDLANQGAFGVEAGVFDDLLGVYTTSGKRHRSETGGYMRIVFNEPRIMKNIGIQSKLELFSNYLVKPENIDVDFENTITIKVNEYISTNLILHFLYDDDIQIALDPEGLRTGPRLQFKEVLGVGLSINIGGAGS